MKNKKKHCIETHIGAVFLLFILLIVAFQILARVFIINPPMFTDALSVWLWIWMVFISMGISAKMDTDLKIDSLVKLFPKKIQYVLKLSRLLLYFVMTVLLIYISIMQSIRIPYSLMGSITVFSGFIKYSYVVGGLFVLYRLYFNIRDFIRKGVEL